MSSQVDPIEISVTVLDQMFLYLASLKIDSDAFLQSMGIDPAQVRRPDARIGVDTYLAIQDGAAKVANDPYFGLHMGEYAEAGSWSILGYLMMNCKTLGEAFEKAGRYSHIIGNLIEARVVPGFQKVRLVFFTPPHAPPMSRHCFDSTFSSSVRMMRSLTGLPLNPLEVTFTYPAPTSTAEYDRIFRCPVRFEYKENSVTIDPSIASIPVRMPNPGLRQYFEAYAQDFLAQMDQKNEVTRKVMRILLEQLDDDQLSLEKVAKQMAISARTLQNRLSDEGVTFSDLLDKTRERLARQYLRENYSVEQITYLLGFSEPSVFRKAFKKWVGVTPKEYREGASPTAA